MLLDIRRANNLGLGRGSAWSVSINNKPLSFRATREPQLFWHYFHRVPKAGSFVPTILIGAY